MLARRIVIVFLSTLSYLKLSLSLIQLAFRAVSSIADVSTFCILDGILLMTLVTKRQCSSSDDSDAKSLSMSAGVVAWVAIWSSLASYSFSSSHSPSTSPFFSGERIVNFGFLREWSYISISAPISMLSSNISSSMNIASSEQVVSMVCCLMKKLVVLRELIFCIKKL